MTEPSPLPPESEEPEQPRKGIGCLYGGLAFVGSWLAGSLSAALLLGLSPTSTDDVLSVVVGLIPIGLLIAAGVRWHKIPGFLMGIGLTFALVIVIFTSCTALLIWGLSSA
jgi:hypothetical protein